MNERDQLEEESTSEGTDEAHELYQTAVERVKSLAKEAKQNSWRQYASTLRYSSNPEKTARVVRQINREPRASTMVALQTAEVDL